MWKIVDHEGELRKRGLSMVMVSHKLRGIRGAEGGKAIAKLFGVDALFDLEVRASPSRPDDFRTMILAALMTLSAEDSALFDR
jgi:hypothetical protein